MAISDQALHYVEKAQQWQAGEQFIENLVATTRQLFESNGPLERRPAKAKTKPESPNGRLLSFAGEQNDNLPD